MDQRPSFDDLPIGESAAYGRRAPRDSMFLGAELICGEGVAQPLKVRNISASGLMAEGMAGCAVGDPVTIGLRGIGPVEGRIIWIEEGRTGIAFDSPIDPRRTRKPVSPAKRVRQPLPTSRRSGLRIE